MIRRTGKDLNEETRRVMVVGSDTELTQILEINLAHSNIEVISVRNGTQVIRKASEEKPEIILFDEVLPYLEISEICRLLKESEQMRHIQIVVMGSEDTILNRIDGIERLADYYITKPFDLNEVVELLETCFKQIERDINASPLTGLPNQIQLDNEFSNLLEQNKTFAAIYVDIDNLRAFNKVYGFVKGDQAIKLLGEIIYEAVGLFGGSDDLAAHLGGDNFVVLTTVTKARMLCPKIIRDFNNRIRTLYNQKHLERGNIEYEGLLGQIEQCPIMTLSVVVVSNERRKFEHYLQVKETAAQLLNYLRHFPGSNYYFDRYESAIEAQIDLSNKEIVKTNRDERPILQRVSRWVSFLTEELVTPTIEIKECLDSLKSFGVRHLVPKQRSNLKSIQENVERLLQVVGELSNLIHGEWSRDEVTLNEVEFKSIFDWIIDNLKNQAEQQGVEFNIKGGGDIEPLMVDQSSLIQGIFCLLSSEVKSSARGDQLKISISETMDKLINIEIMNQNQYIPQRELTMFSQDQFDHMAKDSRTNGFYLAKVLIHSIGGMLSIDSEKNKGTTLLVSIPKRWRSSIEEVNSLLSSAEISRKEARDQLQSMHQILSSKIEQVPSVVEERFENLGNKIQEIMVLCNRSLFMASELSNRLENQQDKLLQREVEQMGISETLVVTNRVIAESLQIGYLFNLESAQRVARNALSMANEFRLTRTERQVLYQAALLKDLALVLSPEDMVERMVVPTIDEAFTIKERFSVIWKELSQLDFLSPVFELLLYRYERHDGMGHPLGVRGSNIPLKARILAIIDTFDSVTSDVTPGDTLSPEMAIQNIVADSGRCFDPNLVAVFQQLWRRGEFQIASNQSERETSIT
ncbi:MAG TPA: diguanylate cyclase [Dehalococcoidia bacterium]|nr:diguanylate cyclase [Dehalococcoidia bacterium]